MYLDVTVGNIFANCHLQDAQRRQGVAKTLEENKCEKYKNMDNIHGLGYEVLGAMSPDFRAVLHELAHARANWSQVPWTIWMNRMRSRLNAKLMEYNASMILHSGILPYVNLDEDDIL